MRLGLFAKRSVRRSIGSASALSALAAAALASGGLGAAEQPNMGSRAPARASLVADVDAAVAGTSFTLGIAFDIDPGWHTYWKGLNDTGAPIGLELELPEGWKAGPVQWPAPTRYIGGGDLLDYVYENEATLLVTIDVPPDTSGTGTISASLQWLVCKDLCLPGSGEFTFTMPVKPAGSEAGPGRGAERIARARDRLPVPIAGLTPAPLRVAWSAEAQALTIELPEGSDAGAGAGGAGASAWLAFYPEETSAAVVDAVRRGRAEGVRLSLPLERAPGQDASSARAVGVVEVNPASAPGSEGRSRLYHIDVPLPGLRP